MRERLVRIVVRLIHEQEPRSSNVGTEGRLHAPFAICNMAECFVFKYFIALQFWGRASFPSSHSLQGIGWPLWYVRTRFFTRANGTLQAINDMCLLRRFTIFLRCFIAFSALNLAYWYRSITSAVSLQCSCKIIDDDVLCISHSGRQ